LLFFSVDRTVDFGSPPVPIMLKINYIYDILHVIISGAASLGDNQKSVLEAPPSLKSPSCVYELCKSTSTCYSLSQFGNVTI
jgi:hypothetical protein